MRINVGSFDRTIRIVLGLVLIAAVFIPGLPMAANPLLQWGVILVGAALIVTALMRTCPLYTILGLSTCKVSNR